MKRLWKLSEDALVFTIWGGAYLLKGKGFSITKYIKWMFGVEVFLQSEVGNTAIAMRSYHLFVISKHLFSSRVRR